jgi:hypothetical protein
MQIYTRSGTLAKNIKYVPSKSVSLLFYEGTLDVALKEEIQRVLRKDGVLVSRKGAIAKLIKAHTKRKALVVDGSMGKGDTGLVCLKLKRVFMGFEENINLYDQAAEKLIQEMTGEKPIARCADIPKPKMRKLF